MTTTIANVICLITGFASAFMLMKDAAGVFSPGRAEGSRIVLALMLCLLGGWFTKAKPGSHAAMHPLDWGALALLAVLAIFALYWAPVA